MSTKTMTKEHLVMELSEKLNMHRSEAIVAVESFFSELQKALCQGESVKMAGFGNFNLRDKHPRPGRNPKTGEAALVSARRVALFHAGLALKAKLGADQAGAEKNS